MRKEDDFEEINIKKSLDFKTIDIRNSNKLNDDNDQETDDILTKLGNLSDSSDDKSFDSPIIFNRTKTFYNRYKTDVKQLLSQTFIMNKNNIDNDNKNMLESFSPSRNKKLKKDLHAKSLLNMEVYNTIQNKKKVKFNKIEKKTYSVEKIPEIIRYNSINNIHNYNKLPSINEIINEHKNHENKNEINDINKKIDDIHSLIKDIKYIDKKRKNDFNKFVDKINNEEDKNNIFKSMKELLDYIIEILISIKNKKEKNNNKIGNEKIILKLQNELKEKDKEIGELINKMNSEKEKLEKSFKSNNTEIINLRKQNNDLTHKILNLQKQISKLESNNEILEEKLNKLILEKTSKTFNSSTSVRGTFISNGLKMEPPSLDESYITQRCFPACDTNKNNNQKLNEKYNISKKLNLNLIDLLKEINNMLCYYDSFLNKELGANKNIANLIKNMINFMDINNLSEDKKMKMVANEYMRNLEIIFKKIEEYIKIVNDNSVISDLKHCVTMKHSSSRVIIKKDKNIKENNNKTLKKRNNVASMKKDIKSPNPINMNNTTRKRTNTINNPFSKGSI